MAKKLIIPEENFAEFDPTTGAAKLPADVKRGREVRKDYYDIPLFQFVPFQGKGKGDFSRLPEDEFVRMVESVRTEGVLEAITCRPIGDKFELLAGETRWRAAREAGLESVPARVLTDCDDARAARIFAITNLNRRHPTIRDRLYGWYTYWNSVKLQGRAGEKALEEDIATIAPSMNTGDIQLRQIQKYYKIYDVLEEPHIKAIEQNIIPIDAAYALAFLTKEQRNEVMGRPMSVKQAEALKALSKQGKWNEEAVAKILGKLHTEKPAYEKSMKRAVSNLRKTITARLNPAKYDDVDKVLAAALELYFTAHPEDVV